MTDQDLLRSYLAGHDAVCPCCGYNLRGLEGGACPECGQALDLGVTEGGPRGFGRRWSLLVLLFAWLMLAGAMNDYRAIRSIHRTLTSQWLQQIFVSTSPRSPSSPAMSGSLDLLFSTDEALVEVETVLAEALEGVDAPSGPAAPDPVRVTVDRSVAADEDAAASAPTSESGPGAVRRSLAIQAGQLPPLFTSPDARPSSGWRWSAVRWTQWAAAAGWLLLAVTGVAGLVVLVLHRRRPVPPRLATAVLGAAWTGFASYVVYHAACFVVEVV